MKKINLFLMAPLASLMFACSDYVGELEDQHDEFVSYREALDNWTSGCSCIRIKAGIEDGVYNPKSGFKYIGWLVTGCNDNVVLSFNEDEGSVFGDLITLDEDGEFVVEMALNEQVLNASLGGSYSPLIVAARSDDLAASVVDCPAVEFLVDTDFGKDESSNSKGDDAKSSSSVKATSSSSSNTSSFKLPTTCGDIYCATNEDQGSAGKAVVPGQTAETSGYWFDFNDNASPNNGNSKIVYPKDVEANAYGNFFGPLADAYGGLKGSVEIGNYYEYYPFVGLGFNLVSENQEGTNISDWEGVCLVYASTMEFTVELRPEDEATYTEYNNYNATVAKSNGTVLNLPWSKFNQVTGFGKTVNKEEFLKRVATIHLTFTASGDFMITSVGRLGTCDGSKFNTSSSSSVTSSSSVKATSSSSSNTSSFKLPTACGDLYCATNEDQGSAGRAAIPGQDGEMSGFWYDYNDNDPPNNGNSKIVYPKDVEANAYGNFFGPLAEAYGGLIGSAQIGDAYEYGFVGLQFDLVSDKREGMDITDWKGVCLVYASTKGFFVELGPEDEHNYTDYNNYKAAVANSNGGVVDLPWSKFKQETGWGNSVNQEEFLKRVATFRLRFANNGEFMIKSVGRLGTCNSSILL